MTAVNIDPFAIGYCVCGRRLGPTNELVGTSCRGCLTEWVNEPDRYEDLPPAVHPSGIHSECQACGTRTWGRDLCVACDPFLEDLGRPW